MEEKKMIGNYDWNTMLLITIFLGAIGVHNFLLGEKKKGILKIILVCTSCLFLPWVGALALWIMDLIKVVKNEYVINTEAWY